MVLQTLVVAICLGILAQALAARLKLPAILPLLLLGIACGPSGLALFRPGDLGETLEPIIHLGVAVILFEGGMSLEMERLRQVRGPVLNLLTLGVAITGVGAAVLAHFTIDLPWQSAALFGAIVTVTGPTVISPLLRHTIAPRRVKTILLSEGLIIDAIGALLAYLVLQWIELQGVPLNELATTVIKVTVVGTVLGYVGGKVGSFLARSRMFEGELSNLIILAMLMLVYMVAEHQAHQSGILAAVVMGFTLTASDAPDLGSLKAFKGQLTLLLISVLFVLLSGQLDLSQVVQLGWGGAVVALGLIFVVRPLSVFLSVWPQHLGIRQRIFLSMTAPRGIVAAAVASLAARQLELNGFEGGSLLEGIVYLAILATGAWATLMSVVLPRVLGYANDKARQRAIIVGANSFAAVLADLMSETGKTTVVVDSSSWRLESFRDRGLSTSRGDARDASTYEDAGVESDSLVIAATTNDELNLLVAELVHHEFGIHHPIVSLQSAPEELGRRSRAWVDLLSGRNFKVPTWIDRLNQGRARRVDLNIPDRDAGDRLEDLVDEHASELAVLCGWRDKEAVFHIEPEQLDTFSKVSLLVADGPAADRLKKLASRFPKPEGDEDANGSAEDPEEEKLDAEGQEGSAEESAADSSEPLPPLSTAGS